MKMPDSHQRCGLRVAGLIIPTLDARKHCPIVRGCERARVARLEADLDRPWWRRWLFG